MELLTEVVNFLAGAEGGSNADIEALRSKIIEIKDLICNIIYIVLAAFLVVKGAIIGMQIVKAADEPQVRQEKIGSLKWLVIGVAIAYGVTGIAHIVTNVMKTSLTFYLVKNNKKPLVGDGKAV